MKKLFLPLFLILAGSLYAKDNPPHISLLLQYANTLVTSPSQTYMQLKKENKDVHIAFDTYLSSSYNFVNIPFSYVYNDTFGISLYLPYAETDTPTQNKQQSIGDTTVEISFNAGKFDDDIEAENNIFGLRYTFATGDEAKMLGGMSDAVAIFWDSTYILDEKWTLYGSLLWNFYLDKKTINQKKYDLGSEDILWFGAKYSSVVQSGFDILAKLNWQGAYNDIPNENYDFVDATLQVQNKTLLQNFPIQAGVKIPIWSDNEVDNEFLFFIGISSDF